MASKPKKKAEAEPVESEEGDAADAPVVAKRKLPLKLILIVAGGLILVGGGGATAYFMLGGAKEAAPAVVAAKPAVFFDVPDVLVNLSTAAGERTQYLTVKIVLELADAALTAQVQTVLPRVMDAFQTYLRELRPTDLDGSAGLYRLKEELTRRVNAAISPARVNAVLFKEIVVQ